MQKKCYCWYWKYMVQSENRIQVIVYGLCDQSSWTLPEASVFCIGRIHRFLSFPFPLFDGEPRWKDCWLNERLWTMIVGRESRNSERLVLSRVIVDALWWKPLCPFPFGFLRSRVKARLETILHTQHNKRKFFYERQNSSRKFPDRLMTSQEKVHPETNPIQRKNIWHGAVSCLKICCWILEG